jgi:DNA-binding NarL/FixJ family response regulator
MKRILVVQGEHLLVDGIISLLTRENDFEVINTIFSDGHFLIDEIEKHHPTVLIMDGSMRLAKPTAILKLLKNCTGLRVIVIDEHKNLIHIFEKQEVAVAGSADLIAAIRRNFGS